MGKISAHIQQMSLKKALMVLAFLCLGLVSLLTAFTIIGLSKARQEIWGSRSVRITEYTLEESSGDEPLKITPEAYDFEPLAGEKRLAYGLLTAALAVLPALYLAAGAAFMAAFYYRLKLQRPLSSLKSGVEHIARRDLDFQLTYASADELGRLCQAFSQMQEEICASNRQMWAMLQERRALTASISHDLRTPLTVLKGYLDYLDKAGRQGKLTDQGRQSTISHMEEALRRLERYVDCVKDIQRVEELEIKREPVQLDSYISGIAKDFSLLAEKRGRALEIGKLTRTKEIQVDRDMLSRVLENLFDNALRFSVNRIYFSVAETPEQIIFALEDDGRGFSREELKGATAFFYSSSKEQGNFGIGLSLSKILCQKLGGDLVLSNGQGGGARAMVQLNKSQLC